MQATGNLTTGPERKRVRLGLLTLVVGALSACAPQGTYRSLAERTPVYPPAAFAHRVAAPDVEIYWNCTRPEPGLIRLDGVAKNTGGREVRFLELQLNSVDARDRYILEVAAALPDIVLYTNQISPFQLDLRTMGNEVRYDLFYQYRIAPRAGFPRSLDSDKNFMARDVCSETQHRISNMGG